MLGLTFDGLHSYEDFGLIMTSKNRPILPEPKIISEDIATIDGTWDFSDFNPYNRTLYKPKVDEIEFTIKERNPVLLRQKAREIAMWLSASEKQLIYDDEPGVYYLARVQNKLDLEYEIRSIKRFTVQFRCRPFSYSIEEVTQSIEASATSYMLIFNDGRPVSPIITIEGSSGPLSISCGSKTMIYDDILADDTLVIDCERGHASIDTSNMTSKLKGNKIEFEHGNNVLEISGDGLDVTITCTFRPRY